MLTALRSGIRFRLTVVLAAFASLCFVAPPAVLALGHGDHTVECLAHAELSQRVPALPIGPALQPSEP